MICSRSTILQSSSSCVLIAMAMFVMIFSVLCSAAVPDRSKDNMLDLTDDNFDQAVRENPLMVVVFYAPWCGHSKKLLPELNSISQGDNSHVKFARFDVTTNPKMAAKYDIKHFPTLKFWRNGHTYTQYEGNRDHIAIDRWVARMSRNAVTVFRNKAHFVDFLNLAQYPAAICVDLADSETCKLFDQAADKARAEVIRWMAFSDLKQIEDFGLSKYSGKIVVARSNDEEGILDLNKFVELKSSPTGSLDELLNEIHIVACPTFGPLDPETYKDYMHVKLPMLYLFMSTSLAEVNKNKESADYKAHQAMKSLAEQYEGKLTFVHIDASKYGALAPRVGLSNDKFPALALDQAGAFYNIPQDGSPVTTERIQKFANDFLAGKLQRLRRSEPSPATHTVDGLTTVTANTFDQLVSNSEQDVFITFYAPWCSHCKELMPKLSAVAAKMKDEELTIAKFDATSNEYDKSKFSVEGFPTLFWIKKGQAPQEYSGGRTADEILEYIRKKVDSE